MMSTQFEEEGEALFQEQGRAPPALVTQVPAGGKSVDRQISYADVVTQVHEGMPSSLAEHTVDSGGGWRATVGKLVNPVQPVGLPEGSCKEDAQNSLLSITAQHKFEEGIVHCTSLQELLLGFTSGALCIVSNQQQHLVQGVSCAEEGVFGKERKDDYCNAECEFGAPQICLQEGYVESELDNEHEESSDGANSGYSDTDDDEPSKDKIYPNEKDLETVDRDTFYSTGELMKKTESSVNTNIQDVQYGQQAATQVENKQGWKKRRRVKDGPNRDAFRLPRGMGAVERAMRQYCEKKEGNIFEPRVGLEFDSEAEAIEFYNLYFWEVGFGIRKGHLDGNKDEY